MSLVTTIAVRELARDLTHERPLVAVAVAARAEHDDEPAVAERARGAEHGRERVRRVRVVDDDREVLPLVDRLEPPRDAGHRPHPGRDRVLVDVEQQRRPRPRRGRSRR